MYDLRPKSYIRPLVKAVAAFCGIATVGGLILALGIVVNTFVSSLVGALMGWVIGLTSMGSWIQDTLIAMGMRGPIHLVHMGATLGFIGGFFRSPLPLTSKKDA